MTTAPERSVPKPVFTDAEAGAKEFPDSNARQFNYYTPAKRKQSKYEDVTVEVQPDPRHYLAQGWLYGFSDGRGGYPLDWRALESGNSLAPASASVKTTLGTLRSGAVVMGFSPLMRYEGRGTAGHGRVRHGLTPPRDHRSW